MIQVPVAASSSGWGLQNCRPRWWSGQHPIWIDTFIQQFWSALNCIWIYYGKCVLNRCTGTVFPHTASVSNPDWVRFQRPFGSGSVCGIRIAIWYHKYFILFLSNIFRRACPWIHIRIRIRIWGKEVGSDTESCHTTDTIMYIYDLGMSGFLTGGLAWSRGIVRDCCCCSSTLWEREAPISEGDPDTSPTCQQSARVNLHQANQGTSISREMWQNNFRQYLCCAAGLIWVEPEPKFESSRSGFGSTPKDLF